MWLPNDCPEIRPKMTALARLQDILHRLFRLDESDDLDFGVYRLINMKRGYLLKYLEEQLPREIIVKVYSLLCYCRQNAY